MTRMPSTPQPGRRRKRRGGCCSCCLFLVLAPLVLLLVLFVASKVWPRFRTDPVEKEWRSIPDYFSVAAGAAGVGLRE
jgi:hypothetical protein